MAKPEAGTLITALVLIGGGITVAGVICSGLAIYELSSVAGTGPELDAARTHLAVAGLAGLVAATVTVGLVLTHRAPSMGGPFTDVNWARGVRTSVVV